MKSTRAMHIWKVFNKDSNDFLSLHTVNCSVLATETAST